MDCKRALELIVPFINEQLNPEDVEAFLNHIDDCPECREELEVNYSLMTAMKQLDENADLSDNYIEELNQKIELCYLDELKRKRAGSRRRAVLGAVVFLLILLNGVTVDKRREEEDRRFFRRITGTEEDAEKDNTVQMSDKPVEEKEDSGVEDKE